MHVILSWSFIFMIICSCSESRFYYGKSEAGSKNESYENDDEGIDIFSIGNGQSENTPESSQGNDSVYRLKLAGVFNDDSLGIRSLSHDVTDLTISHIAENHYEIHYSGERLDAVVYSQEGKGVRIIADSGEINELSIFKLEELNTMRFNFLQSKEWEESLAVQVKLDQSVIQIAVINDGHISLEGIPNGSYQVYLISGTLNFSKSVFVSGNDLEINVETDYHLSVEDLTKPINSDQKSEEVKAESEFKPEPIIRPESGIKPHTSHSEGKDSDRKDPSLNPEGHNNSHDDRDENGNYSRNRRRGAL